MQNSAGSHSIKTKSDYKRSAADLYMTPFSAVEKLYTHAPWMAKVVAWDSSAGLGHIVSHIHTLGGVAVGTELNNHPFPKSENIRTGVDLFALTERQGDYFVCNPPFNDWQRHVEHMLSLNCPGWALLRLNAIAAKKVKPLLNHLAEILIIGRERILPPGVEDKGLQPSIDFAWLRFEVLTAPSGVRVNRA